MLAAARCLRAGHEAIVAGKWRTWSRWVYIGQDLAARRSASFGLGRIGTASRGVAAAVGDMKVLYHNTGERRRRTDLGATLVDLPTLLTRAMSSRCTAR